MPMLITFRAWATCGSIRYIRCKVHVHISNVYFLQYVYLVRVAFTSHEDQVLQGVW